MACRRHALPSHRQCDGVAHTAFVGDATKFAENYSLKSAGENACVAGSWLRESRDPVVSLRLLWCLSGEHMFHGKSGKYLRF